MNPVITRDIGSRVGQIENDVPTGRILLIADSYVPTPTSTAKLVKDLADELARRGMCATVLVPSPNSDGACEVSLEGRLEVIRVKTNKVKGLGKIRRGLREVRFSQQIWRLARPTLSQRSFDLIIFFSPSIFFGSLVERLKKLFGCPAYLVLRDLWTQFMLDVGELRPGLAHKYLSRFERQQYSAADVIGLQSPGDLRYFGYDDPPGSSRVEVLLNWYSVSAHQAAPSSYREHLGLRDRVVFLFSGNFGVAQDPLNVLRLAGSLTLESHIHFLLVGWGSHLPEMHKVISQQDLTNVTLLDAVPQEEFISMVSEFDVGLISLDRRFKINNLPGRLLAYFSAGLPALASVNPNNDLFSILNENGAGYCCRNGDDESFREYALALANDRSLRLALGQHGRALLETFFSPRRAADQILSHFSLRRAASSEDCRYAPEASI